MTFNLLDEKWIPVLWQCGSSERVGIRTALTQAGRIRQIAATNPMDRMALLRFLLAILYWCRGNPPVDTSESPSEEPFAGDWFGRLEEQADSFNLMGDKKRFYQNPIYKERKPEHTVNYLIHEVPSGTNKWHFRHVTDEIDGLCAPCCATGLLRLPLFATSGGRGMSAATGKSWGVNAKPPLYVVPVGSSLAATLRHSWQPTALPLGTPEWESPGQPLPSKGPVPLMMGLTWLPRSVWLGDLEEPEAACAHCGHIRPLVRRCVFDGKGSNKAGDRKWRDPHVIYEQSDDDRASALQTSNALDSSDAAAGRWARTMAAILKARVSTPSASLWVVGFATVQNDKYLEASEWLIPPVNLSQQDQQQIASLERWQRETGNLARSIHRKMPASSRKHLNIRPVLDAVRPDVETRVLRRATQDLLVGNDGADRAAREYASMMSAVATSLSPGFTTRALQRRNSIAQIVPNMSARPTVKPRRSTAKREDT